MKKSPPKTVWKKTPAEWAARFDRLRPHDPDVERRTMFGYPCLFVRGRMFAGLFADRMFVRVPESERDAWLASGRGRPFAPMPGRVMRDYLEWSGPSLEDDEEIKKFLNRALVFARTLPEKIRNSKREKS
jgi:TfoX/Sxy family transcriptional regulator of competence genes